MRNRILYCFLLLLFLGDAWYSFNQFRNASLDGDLAENVVPAPDYKKVLSDPFGLDVLLKKEPCAAPNRFFAHWTMSKYFKSVPLLLQPSAKPIDSVYLSCAIAKTLIQIFIIFLLACYITGTNNFFKTDFLIAAVLITPLFQTSGYGVYMGIIDPTITYTFFYALPLSLVLLFFLPFYRLNANQKEKINIPTKILLAVLALVLAFNGPLIPGIVLLVCPMILLHKLYLRYKESMPVSFFSRIISALKKLPRSMLFYFLLICFLCIYSLYIGTYNTDNLKYSISLAERYARIPAGLYEMLTQKLGWPLLLIMVGVNIFIIKEYFSDEEGKKIIRLLKWIGVFSLIYIALLPLGGFRIYRPNVLRYDTIMPITISMIFIYGLSSFFLIKKITGQYKWMYLGTIAIFMWVYTNADEPVTDNYCERAQLEKLAASSEKIVRLDTSCKIMSWEKIEDSKNSETNTTLLQYWGVIHEQKFYYQK